jgi:hypothetical protein
VINSKSSNQRVDIMILIIIAPKYSGAKIKELSFSCVYGGTIVWLYYL